MDDFIGIILEHAGPIGVALCVLAVYLLHRFDMLPTYRARIEWVEPEPMQEQAKQLVPVGQRMQSMRGQGTPNRASDRGAREAQAHRHQGPLGRQ